MTERLLHVRQVLGHGKGFLVATKFISSFALR